MRRRLRGQGMSELALGSLVFVSLLILGIHLSEVGVLQMRVTEAAASALWDTTHAKVHNMPAQYDTIPLPTAVSGAGIDATRRYADFDGRSGFMRGSTIEQTFTQGTGMSVTCRTGGSVNFGLPGAPIVTSSGAYADNPGFNCRATAQLAALRIPRAFLEDNLNGFFQKQHWERVGIPICSQGRASGGACSGTFPMLIDDWGLSENEEGLTCALKRYGEPCDGENMPFYLRGKVIFDANGAGRGRAATELAEKTVPMNRPLRPVAMENDQYYFSFLGEDQQFRQRLPDGRAEGLHEWHTSPYRGDYVGSHGARTPCYLGLRCDGPNPGLGP